MEKYEGKAANVTMEETAVSRVCDDMCWGDSASEGQLVIMGL